MYINFEDIRDTDRVDEFMGFDEEDGLSDDPASLSVQTACTGPHYAVHKPDFAKFVQYAEEMNDPQKALLLLPIKRLSISAG